MNTSHVGLVVKDGQEGKVGFNVSILLKALLCLSTASQSHYMTVDSLSCFLYFLQCGHATKGFSLYLWRGGMITATNNSLKHMNM